MKNFCIIIFSLIFTLFLFCEHNKAPLTTSHGYSFALYLVKDFDFSEHENIILNNLKLEFEPFLTIDDITEYQWEKHIITMTPVASNRLHTLFKDWQSFMRKPFVVMVNNERIYYGFFYGNHLSSISNKPVIMLDMFVFNKNSDTLRLVRAYPSGDENNPLIPDVRKDQRIYDVLLQANKLRL